MFCRNYAETAFLIPIVDGYGSDRQAQTNSWHLRWWTPAKEVKLCGHATLASAHILLSEDLVADTNKPIVFHTKYSGQLIVNLSSSTSTSSNAMPFKYTMDFPALMFGESLNDNKSFQNAVNTALCIDNRKDVSVNNIVESGEDLLVEIKTNDINSIQPNFGFIKENKILQKYRCILMTTNSQKSVNKEKGQEYDFISRVFAPMYGVDEDPVTGSAHCSLAVYWADKLNKANKVMRAYQASQRGGNVVVKWDKNTNRVLLNGDATTTFTCKARFSKQIQSKL